MWFWDSLSHLPFSWACSCLSLECSWNFITEMLRWTSTADIKSKTKFWTNQKVTCLVFTSILYLSFKVYWLLLFRSVWGESYTYVSTGTITCTCMWEGHRTQCWVSFLSCSHPLRLSHWTWRLLLWLYCLVGERCSESTYRHPAKLGHLNSAHTYAASTCWVILTLLCLLFKNEINELKNNRKQILWMIRV